MQFKKSNKFQFSGVRKMEKYRVLLFSLKTKKEMETTIYADEGETTDDIILKVQIDDQEVCAVDTNYLPAYQKLRDKLLKMGYGIKCNGSRLNALQSGMMGANEKIYLVKLGEQALNKDIVSLYEYAEIDEFPNTEEQIAFSQKWFNSIR